TEKPPAVCVHSWSSSLVLMPATFLSNSLKGGVVIFEDLGDQFHEFPPRLLDDLASGTSGPIVLSSLSDDDLRVTAQVAQALELMESGVERALAEPVAVTHEFLSDFGPLDRVLGRVV